MDKEEYRVCQAFLDSPYAEKPHDLLYEKLGIFFIYNIQCDDPKEVEAFLSKRAGIQLDPELCRSFTTINRFPMRIDWKQLSGSMRYSPQFMQKDVYSLSRVGFNARRDEALFYATYSSMIEDGHGSLFYLRKVSGAWTVTKGAAVWMMGAGVDPFELRP